MKKGFKKVLVTGLIMASATGFAACGPQKDDGELKYNFYNYDNSYIVYGNFSMQGAKLIITQKDGSIKEIDINDDMVKSMPDMTTAGTKTIIIVYEGQEYVLTIDVVNAEQVGYSFTGYLPLYSVNDNFDISNLKLHISYNNGQVEDVAITQSMIEQMPDMTKQGQKVIIVNYNSAQYSFNFEVGDLKEAMLTKLQDFMSDYNSTTVKDSSIKINVAGLAKYLENNAEFNTELMNIQLSNILKLDGYEIGKIQDTYIFTKEYANMNDLNNDYDYFNFFNLNYIVIQSCPTYSRSYGTVDKDYIGYLISEAGETVEPVTVEEFKKTLNLTRVYSGNDKYITVYNSVFAQPIYKAITNAIVNSTMNIQSDEIISANESLSAKLDIIKTLQNIYTNSTNIDYYDLFINHIVFTKSNSFYVDLATQSIVSYLGISKQSTIDDLQYALTKDIKAIKEKKLTDVSSFYDMIVELNDIIKESDANTSIAEKIDIIVSGLDEKDAHTLSKFAYALRDLDDIYSVIEGETSDYEEATSGNRWCYASYYNQGQYIYQYQEYVTVANADELINTYYSGLKAIIECFENIPEYTNIKDFTNDIINNIRAMDVVVQEVETNGYYGVFLGNTGLTTTIRTAIEYYNAMYDAHMIADIIDMLALTQPENSETEVNPIYLGLDAHLINALHDCSDTIYLAFGNSSSVDYIKLIEDLCGILDVEKDYYIDQFKQGNITIFTDLFDRFIPNYNEATGATLAFNTAVRHTCEYLDSLFVENIDRTEFVNEIHNSLTAAYNMVKEELNDPQTEMILDCLVKMTNTEKDFYGNFKDIVSEYKTMVKEYSTMLLSQVLNIDSENTTAINELKNIINFHLTAYIRDEFIPADLITDLTTYIDQYCDEPTSIYAKTSAVLGIILFGQEENIDYNELFENVELPPEIQSVDFNKLIKETLRDKDTYDILSINDVKVDYITDDQGNIIKEVLTVSLKANYDILLSSLDADLTLTIEINF